MKKLFLALLLACGLAHADPNIYTKNAVSSGGGTSFPVTVTGGVSGGIPCFTSTTTEAASTLLAAGGVVIGGGAGVCPSTDTNLVWDATNKRLQVGSTTNGTSTGLIMGYYGVSGAAALWNAAVTPSASNYALYTDNNANTVLNAATGRELDLSINNTNIFQVTANGLGFVSNHLLLGKTAPVIASGFGGTPSIPANNGTAAFTVNVGTGGAASSGVITMPAATTGWACTASPTGAPQAAAVTYSAPTSTTSITLTNYTLTTGIALAWTASTVLSVMCMGY